MKALAIDSATTKLYIAAKNEDLCTSCQFDIGMKQSETLLPAILYCLEKVNLKATELNYTVLTSGPGSFTGLRLAFSALKALTLANNIPLYGIPTLKAYSYTYKTIPFPILTCLDAKKERFYAECNFNEKEIFPAADLTVEEIAKNLTSITEESFSKIIVAGPDSFLLKEQLSSLVKQELIPLPFFECVTESLFKIAEQIILQNVPPLNDYDGPEYLRASEAEVKILQK